MSDRLRVQCPEGDFAVESRDEEEIIRIIQEHARFEHDLDIEESELHEIVEDEESAGIE